MILTRAQLAELLAQLDSFLVRNPDYPDNGHEPTVCAYCREIGIGRWTCYCRRDD